MIDQKKFKAFLIELLDQANEVEADTGETPTAQEAIDWIIAWVDDQSSNNNPPLDIPPA